MSFTPGNIIQYSENYPFLPIAIRMQTANSWTRENTTGNNFLGNGGTELNTTSNLYDLAYRNYDPILGRMNQIDPMATKYASLTPYNFSFNDPVTFTDPSGADPEYGITRYTYDDRVDHYRGQFYSGGSTSALRFHTGGRSGGITNWSYAPSFGQLVQMRNDARSLNSQAYGEKYGEKVSWWLAYSKNNYEDSKEQASMWLYFDKSFHNDFNGVYQWYGAVNGGFARKYAQAYEPWSAKYIDDFEYLANFTQGGSTSSDFIYDNNNSIGLGLEIIENGTTEAIEEVLKNKALYTTGAKIGAKVVGGSVIGLNLGVTFYTIGKELQSNDPKAFNTHSFVNMGVTVLTTGATAIGIIFAGATAPVWVPAVAIGGAAIGIGYGIAQVAGIDEWIDSRYGFK